MFSQLVRQTVLLGLFLSVTASAVVRRPNVIVVMTDDQGYGDLRCHGNSMIKTPHLDRLHSQSVRFTDFHVDPTCSPTRAALLTGRYSTRTGVWHTVMGRSILFEDEVTLAEIFRQAGYRTGIFGKWHLGDNYPSRPGDRGFTEVLIHGGGGVGQTPDHWGNDYFDDTYLHNGQWKPTEGYCTKVFFDHALSFIEQNRRQPFFCYLPTNVPHSPNNVARKYSQPYLNQGAPENMAKFYGMITEFDENLGRLTANLNQLGIADDTILIFLTDNGSAAGVWRKRSARQKTPRWTGFNAGMQGSKGSHFDGGHRVPFFIRWPAAGIGGGRDVDRLAAHIDVLPTLAELCQLPLPKGRQLDGTSLVPLLRGTPGNWPDRTLFAHFQREELPPKWTRSSVMTERWRLLDGERLYDIDADPGQQKDVSWQHDDVVMNLRAQYEKWWRSLEPRLPLYGWIKLGTPHESPSRLNCMDWHVENTGQSPWNQPHIRKGLKANGYWMVDFTQSGTYRFTLRQKPAAADEPIEATVASVWVGNREITAPIPAEARSVSLTMEITAGKKRMQTYLVNEADGASRGAYFVDVELLR
jgi:arylsulfatase A-like enzyme